MALSQLKIAMLQQLSTRHLTVIDLKTDQNIRMVQELVNLGYARDFSAHHGHRIEVRLRIWGITSSGKAVLEQQAMVDVTRGRQPALPFASKKLLPSRSKVKFDHQDVGVARKDQEKTNAKID